MVYGEGYLENERVNHLSAATNRAALFTEVTREEIATTDGTTLLMFYNGN
jgi:hypothetical protein